MVIKKILVICACFCCVLACDSNKGLNKTESNIVDLNYTIRIQSNSALKQSALIYVPLPLTNSRDQVLVDYSLTGTAKTKPNLMTKGENEQSLAYELGDVEPGFVRVINVKTKISFKNKSQKKSTGSGSDKVIVNKLQEVFEGMDKENKKLSCLKKGFYLVGRPQLSMFNAEVFLGVRMGDENQFTCWVSFLESESRVILDPQNSKIVKGVSVNDYVAFKRIDERDNSDRLIKDMLLSARGVSASFSVSK